MDNAQSITAVEFRAKYTPTGEKRDAIFGSKRALMQAIYATGEPIFCDQSYYAQYSNYYRVTKVGEHFQCDGYAKFEDWRDCHYYRQFADSEGNKVWLMTGGRYD